MTMNRLDSGRSHRLILMGINGDQLEIQETVLWTGGDDGLPTSDLETVWVAPGPPTPVSLSNGWPLIGNDWR
jgi:malate/lactate dehydrogenase